MKNAGVAIIVALGLWAWSRRAQAAPPPGTEPPGEWPPVPPTPPPGQPPVITPAPPVTNTGYLKWMTFPPGVSVDIGWRNAAGVTVTFDRMFITAVPSSYGVGMKPDGSLIWWTGAAVIPYTGLSVIDGHPYSLYYQQTLPISGPTSFPPGPV